LRFSASLKIMDLAGNGIDVAIRFSNSVDRSLFAMPLAAE